VHVEVKEGLSRLNCLENVLLYIRIGEKGEEFLVWCLISSGSLACGRPYLFPRKRSDFPSLRVIEVGKFEGDETV